MSTNDGVYMFEYDQKIVEALLDSNEEFQALYKEHNELKEKVHKAEIGTRPLDDLTLGHMKKTKLMGKDRMAELIREYREAHAVA